MNLILTLIASVYIYIYIYRSRVMTVMTAQIRPWARVLELSPWPLSQVLRDFRASAAWFGGWSQVMMWWCVVQLSFARRLFDTSVLRRPAWLAWPLGKAIDSTRVGWHSALLSIFCQFHQARFWYYTFWDSMTLIIYHIILQYSAHNVSMS